MVKSNIVTLTVAPEVPPALYHKVRVTSQPVEGVPVTVDGIPIDGTPLTVEMSPATYVIVVPPAFKDFPFLEWEDGSTDPTRIIEITESEELIAYYKPRAPPRKAFIIGGLIAAFTGITIGALVKKRG